jgi:hypothetical protein
VSASHERVAALASDELVEVAAGHWKAVGICTAGDIEAARRLHAERAEISARPWGADDPLLRLRWLP